MLVALCNIIGREVMVGNTHESRVAAARPWKQAPNSLAGWTLPRLWPAVERPRGRPGSDDRCRFWMIASWSLGGPGARSGPKVGGPLRDAPCAAAPDDAAPGRYARFAYFARPSSYRSPP